MVDAILMLNRTGERAEFDMAACWECGTIDRQCRQCQGREKVCYFSVDGRAGHAEPDAEHA